MYILESGSFNASVLSLDLQTTEELPLVRIWTRSVERRVLRGWQRTHVYLAFGVMAQFLETTNCIKTPTNQILWAALDTIMQVCTLTLRDRE